MNKLNVGCGEFYAEGWVNTEWQDQYRHDVLITDPHDSFPFPTEHFDLVYMGHVLEHVPYDDVPAFLQQARQVLKPGGRIMVVGPDVYKAIRMWKLGWVDWDLVTRCLESHHDLSTTDRHHWNCDSERVAGMLRRAGFTDIVQHDLMQGHIPDWPIVGYDGWQCAVEATKPGGVA